MKGTFFQSPLELNLTVEGETWVQGSTLNGALVLKNRGSAPVTADGIRVVLARGDLKKAKLKKPGAFALLQETLTSGFATFEPGQDFSFSWSFKTDLNAPVTDSLSSLFVLVGRGDALETYGSLQLNFQPAPVIQEWVRIFLANHHFAFRFYKGSKGHVEAKLGAPSGQAFASLDHLVVSFSFVGTTLTAESEFHLKKVEATAASFDVKKHVKSISHTLNEVQYLTSSGRIHFESIEAAVAEAVALVESKILF